MLAKLTKRKFGEALLGDYKAALGDYKRSFVTYEYYVLDVWGEGRILRNNMTTGFNSYNIDKGWIFTYEYHIINFNKQGVQLQTKTQHGLAGKYTQHINPPVLTVAGYPTEECQTPFKIPVRTESFDVLTSMCSPLHLLTSQEMYRVLKSGGLVYLYGLEDKDRNNFQNSQNGWIYGWSYQGIKIVTQLPKPFNEIRTQDGELTKVDIYKKKDYFLFQTFKF